MVFDPRKCPGKRYGSFCGLCIDTGGSRCPAMQDVELHPDFTISNGVSYLQNRYGAASCTENSKVCFTFADLSLMDGCPFPAKIGFNRRDGPRYFGVAYAESLEKLDQIRAWATRFEDVWEVPYG